MSGRAPGAGRVWSATVDGWFPKTSLYSLNARGHWGKRKRLQEDAAGRVGNALMVAANRGEWPCGWPFFGRNGLACTITLTVSQQRGGRPDGDNLQGALKHCRDTIAKALMVDDGDTRVEWRYRWVRGADGVLIELEEVA